MDPDQVRRFDGQTVVVKLTPAANAGPEVRGRIVGLIEAADGLVVVLEPGGGHPLGARTSVHYQHIQSISSGTSPPTDDA